MSTSTRVDAIYHVHLRHSPAVVLHLLEDHGVEFCRASPSIIGGESNFNPFPAELMYFDAALADFSPNFGSKGPHVYQKIWLGRNFSEFLAHWITDHAITLLLNLASFLFHHSPWLSVFHHGSCHAVWRNDCYSWLAVSTLTAGRYASADRHVWHCVVLSSSASAQLSFPSVVYHHSALLPYAICNYVYCAILLSRLPSVFPHVLSSCQLLLLLFLLAQESNNFLQAFLIIIVNTNYWFTLFFWLPILRLHSSVLPSCGLLFPYVVYRYLILD